MTQMIHSQFMASITELKKSPMAVLERANGHSVAILNHKDPAFYCVPPELFSKMLDALDEKDLGILNEKIALAAKKSLEEDNS